MKAKVGLSRFVIDGGSLHAFLTAPEGPVAAELRLRAQRIKVMAQAHCPVETEESAAQHRRSSGRLRASIRMVEEGNGRVVIGSDLPFAARIEFNPRVGGWLRGALASEVGAAAFRPFIQTVTRVARRRRA